MLIVLKVAGKTDGRNLFQILLYYFFKAKKRSPNDFSRLAAAVRITSHRQLLSLACRLLVALH